jgi:ubiquitin-protein ligase
MNPRNCRMNTEWQLLESLADANRSIFTQMTRLDDEFRFIMQESPAWVGKKSDCRAETKHALRYVYPRYYPSLPLEGYFVRPILHINVDPLTGFVCLWKNYRPAQTIVDAILITRAIMAGKAANWDPAHRMQQDAVMNPLPMPSLILSADCHPLLPQRSSRRRLGSEIPDHTSQERNFAFPDIE